MKLYADLPARRTAQLLADIFALCWIGIWAWVGRAVHDAVGSLRQPTDELARAGGSFRDSMTGAGEQLSRLPLVGDRLRQPFDSAADTGVQISQVGRDLGTAVDRMALVLALVTALTPIVLVTGIWLASRIRFVRRATAAQRFLDADADLDLFALRAIARQPMHRLARISADPAGAWRRREVATVRSLALLELRSSGLRPPGELRE